MNIDKLRPWVALVLGLLVILIAEMQLGYTWLAVLGVLIAALALWTVFGKRSA